MTAHAEQLEFQAEARQLLDLMVHSVYSNKDSFLRELISNASDALDKLRLEAFRNKDLDVDTSDLHIEIEVDKGARTLTVRDNGIGMTREEVVDLIGTLAKSGTAELRAQLREAKNAVASEELIGQFGIGFYSTFMVADKVELLTRKAGESQATRWQSSGEGTYTIESVDDAPQGTSVSRPQSSPLMKLAMRPKKRPKGTTAATRSNRLQMGMPLRRAKRIMAMVVPVRPPWKDMPPFQIWTADGILDDGLQVVKEDVADASAEDDADGGPDDEIVELRPGDRRDVAGPERVVGGDPAGVEPAEHDACDIGDAVPMNRERADRKSDRIDIGEGHYRKKIGCSRQGFPTR